jgi:hypothetical protein
MRSLQIARESKWLLLGRVDPRFEMRPAADLDCQRAKAILGSVEGDALDGARQSLNQGLSAP